MKDSPTLFDKVTRRFKNNPVGVFLLIVIIGGGAILAIISQWNNLFPKKNKIIPELPNINAKVVIDNISDSTFFYHFEISNNSNVTARNILVACSDGDMFRNEFSSPMNVDLSSNSTMRETGSIIPNHIVPLISIFLVVKYRTQDDSVRNCLFRFMILKEEFQVKEYNSNVKNCENHAPNKERIGILIRNIKKH